MFWDEKKIPYIDTYLFNVLKICSSHLYSARLRNLFPVNLFSKDIETSLNVFHSASCSTHLSFLDILT